MASIRYWNPVNGSVDANQSAMLIKRIRTDNAFNQVLLDTMFQANRINAGGFSLFRPNPMYFESTAFSQYTEVQEKQMQYRKDQAKIWAAQMSNEMPGFNGFSRNQDKPQFDFGLSSFVDLTIQTQLIRAQKLLAQQISAQESFAELENPEIGHFDTEHENNHLSLTEYVETLAQKITNGASDYDLEISDLTRLIAEYLER